MSLDLIRLAFFDTPVHEASAAVVLRVLEAHGLENVELITGSKAGLLKELVAGQIDIFSTVWLPDIHKDMLNQIPYIRQLGNLYQPFSFFALSKNFQNKIHSFDQIGAFAELNQTVVVPETLYDYAYYVFQKHGFLEKGFLLQNATEEEAFASYNETINFKLPNLMVLSQPSIIASSEFIFSLELASPFQLNEHKAAILIQESSITCFDEDLLDELGAVTLGNQVLKLMEQAIRFDGMDCHEAAEAWQRGKLITRI